MIICYNEINNMAHVCSSLVSISHSQSLKRSRGWEAKLISSLSTQLLLMLMTEQCSECTREEPLFFALSSFLSVYGHMRSSYVSCFDRFSVLW